MTKLVAVSRVFWKFQIEPISCYETPLACNFVSENKTGKGLKSGRNGMELSLLDAFCSLIFKSVGFLNVQFVFGNFFLHQSWLHAVLCDLFRRLFGPIDIWDRRFSFPWISNRSWIGCQAFVAFFAVSPKNICFCIVPSRIDYGSESSVK